jgi:UDP-GlcNAc:undecaprenyl-phosphate GlcNAc-1-phosphate transferase
MCSFLANAEIQYGVRSFTADQVLSPYVYVFIASYLVSFLFTPLMRAIASYFGIIDRPDGVRKMHSVPIAYLGGAAVFLGWLAGLAMSQWVPMHRVEEGLPRNLVIAFPIVVAACIIVLLGLWDDIFRVTPWAKITVQVIAAACLWQGGIGRRLAAVVLAPVLLRMNTHLGWPGYSAVQWFILDSWAAELLSLAMIIFVIVLCCNAANLMDGLDGLSAGVTGVVSAGYLFLAVHLAMESGAMNANQDALRVVIALALLGGVLGFVPYNFNPASIFMGDTGSMFLGFCCSLLMILFVSSEQMHFKWFLASVVMFSLPLLDTALAFTRRWVNGRPLFAADRFHLHHQLVARGYSVKQTVIIMYGLSVMFVLLGAAIVYVRTRYAICLYLVVFGSLVVASVKMGMVHERVKVAVRKGIGVDADAVKSEQASPGAVLEVRERPSVPPKLV